MQSWMMTFWLNKHDKREWPELPIYQPDDASHVTRAEEHPSKEVIEAMCSEGFFTRHSYRYIEKVQRSVTDTDDYEDPFESYDTPAHQSLQESPLLDLHRQSTKECLSTDSISSGYNSKVVEEYATGNSESLLHDTMSDFYRLTTTQEQTAEQESDFTESDSKQEAEEDPHEYYNESRTHQSPRDSPLLDLHRQSPRECSSTDSISSGYNSKVVEEYVTGNSESLLHDTMSDFYRLTTTQEQTAEQESDFTESDSKQEAEEDPHEYYNESRTHQSPRDSPLLDLHRQSPRECLSTVSISSDHHSKFIEGDAKDPCNSERLLHETINDSYRLTAEQDSEFTERNDSNSSYPAAEEMFGDKGDCSMCHPEDFFVVNPQYKLAKTQTKYGGEEKEEDDDNAKKIYQDDAAGVEADKNASMPEMRLDDDTSYRELNASSKGYMPLTKMQWKAEEPCLINSQNKDFKTALTQCSSNNSADECYMCVDLLGQSLPRGKEAVSSDEYYENTGYQVNYDSREDMAIQVLLKTAECLYQDIVQKRKNGQETESDTAENYHYLPNQSCEPRRVPLNDHLVNYSRVATNV